MLILFALILLVPILNWIAFKRLIPKSKPKRFLLWFVTTWILELIVFISALAVA